MPRRSLTSLAPRLRALARRFAKQNGGIAAVEFALILPVMLLFYLGTVQITRIVNTSSRISSISDTVADLVARSKTVDENSIGNIFAISTAILNPYKLTGLQIVVTAVRVDKDGKGTVHWSRANSSEVAHPQPKSEYPVPDDIKTYKDNYFLVSKVTYTYDPDIKFITLPGDRQYEYTNVFRPRKSVEVTPPAAWTS